MNIFSPCWLICVSSFVCKPSVTTSPCFSYRGQPHHEMSMNSGNTCLFITNKYQLNEIPVSHWRPVVPGRQLHMYLVEKDSSSSTDPSPLLNTSLVTLSHWAPFWHGRDRHGSSSTTREREHKHVTLVRWCFLYVDCRIANQYNCTHNKVAHNFILTLMKPQMHHIRSTNVTLSLNRTLASASTFVSNRHFYDNWRTYIIIKQCFSLPCLS